ncbi:MAG: thiamine phosphate synthase [Elusimicrobiota bacterium]
MIKIKGLYCITAGTTREIPDSQTVEHACAGGADVIQLRAKNLNAMQFMKAARDIREITSRYNVPLIINDRLDIALMCGADGMHVGQDDMPPAEVKSFLASMKVKDFIVGISTHSFEQAMEAERQGADYISVGPVFKTPTKPEYGQVGVELIKKVKSKVKIPVVAIGGIDETNINLVLDAGPDCVAVVRAVCGSPNVTGSAARLKKYITDFRVGKE